MELGFRDSQWVMRRLNRDAARANFRLNQPDVRELRAGGNAQLRLHQIDASHFFRHGVLHLHEMPSCVTCQSPGRVSCASVANVTSRWLRMVTSVVYDCECVRCAGGLRGGQRSHLNARVHLDEIVPALLIDEEFDRAGIGVPAVLRVLGSRSFPVRKVGAGGSHVK